MNRTPPIKVRRQLRKDVYFGCPVPGCGNPYLEWHHFDPVWNVHNHHSANGMIALCSMHHRQADAGAFSVEQLHQFKTDAAVTAHAVEGQFHWRRNRLLAYVGGNHYLETYEIFRFQGHLIIWFSRDKFGNLMLNMHPILTTGESRFVMEENFWMAHGNQEDLDCPPSGRLLHAKYPNGDEFRIEFIECESTEKLLARYPKGHPKLAEIGMPITVVEVQYRLAGTDIDFGPDYSHVGSFHMTRSFAQSCKTIFEIV